MPDEGSRLTDKAVSQVERRIRKIYKEAEQDIARKMADFTAKHARKDAEMRAKRDAGEITEEEYQRWQRGQVFIGDQWEAKKESIAETLHHANETAQKIVNEQARNVFATNFNWQNYELEHTSGIDMGFGLYDSATVGRLIRERPKMLPQPKPGKYKDNKWNNRNISNSITQSIIQGESIPEAAKRLAQTTGETNMKAMRMHTRTALTGAQNAGRIEAMHEQQEMGIEVKKKWIATLDDRTRDTHAELDGQTVDVDEPFVVYDSKGHKMEIMEPGDPNADPSLVYNCRCKLGHVYPKYDHLVNHDRMAKTIVEDKDEDGNVIGTHVEYKNVGNVTFKEWQEGKRAQVREGNSGIDAEDVRKTVDEYSAQASKIEADIAIEEEKYQQLVGKSIFAFGTDEYDSINAEIEQTQSKIDSLRAKSDSIIADRTAYLSGNGEEQIKKAFGIIEGKHDIYADADAVNTITGDPQTQKNCGYCALAYDARRRGVNCHAALGYGANNNQVSEWWSGLQLKSAASYYPSDAAKEIEKAALEFGEGARGIIQIDWSAVDGHYFVFEVNDGKCVFIDPQTGSTNAASLFDGALPGTVRFGRTDNRELSKFALLNLDKGGAKK